MISTVLRIKELLRERRWTTKVLAEKTGMSESYLTHIKNGTRRWNEDALKKLAIAFDLEPIDVFIHRKGQDKFLQSVYSSKSVEGVSYNAVPVLGAIPSNPSPYNNRMTQLQTGYKNIFVPFINDDPALFCLCVRDDTMSPKFFKNDYLIISPQVLTRSGDIAAVEYGDDMPVRAIKKITYSDDLIILNSVSQNGPPTILLRGKDNFRVLGKVIYRYQNFQ